MNLALVLFGCFAPVLVWLLVPLHDGVLFVLRFADEYADAMRKANDAYYACFPLER